MTKLIVCSASSPMPPPFGSGTLHPQRYCACLRYAYPQFPLHHRQYAYRQTDSRRNDTMTLDLLERGVRFKVENVTSATQLSQSTFAFFIIIVVQDAIWESNKTRIIEKKYVKRWNIERKEMGRGKKDTERPKMVSKDLAWHLSKTFQRT